MKNDNENRSNLIILGILLMTLFLVFVILLVYGTYFVVSNKNAKKIKIRSNVVKSEKVLKSKRKIENNKAFTDNFNYSNKVYNNEPERTLRIPTNTSNDVISNLRSNNVKIRKAIFNDMLRAYQNAFCTDEAKRVDLPGDLFETLAKSLPQSGSSDISINEFIYSNYIDLSTEKKIAIQQTLSSMKEVSGIRLWDITKSLGLYGILKSNNIELNRENLRKAQSCMNGKWDYNGIETDFYNKFGIPPQKTNKILNSLYEDEWMKAQTSFGLKFLNMNNI